MLPTTQSSGLLNRLRQKNKTKNISSPNTFMFNRASSARTTPNTPNTDDLSLFPMRPSSARSLLINTQSAIKYELDHEYEHTNDEKNDIHSEIIENDFNRTSLPLFPNNSTTNDQLTNDNSLTFIHYSTTEKNEKIINNSSSSDTSSTSSFVSTSISASSNWSSATSDLTKNASYKSENIKIEDDNQGLCNPDPSIMDSLHDTSPVKTELQNNGQFPDTIELQTVKSRQSQDSVNSKTGLLGGNISERWNIGPMIRLRSDSSPLSLLPSNIGLKHRNTFSPSLQKNRSRSSRSSNYRKSILTVNERKRMQMGIAGELSTTGITRISSNHKSHNIEKQMIFRINVGEDIHQQYYIADKLVYFSNIEKLLPPEPHSQLFYALLNIIFCADLYYAFQWKTFSDYSASAIADMDAFFGARRALSIVNTLPDVLPSSIWYEIIGYEPSPFKSMSWYLYIRKKDARHLYKAPVFCGYIEMLFTALVTITFCAVVDFHAFGHRSIFNHSVINHEYYALNILCYILLTITALHLCCIFIVWYLTWIMLVKISEYKKSIHHYLKHASYAEKQRMKLKRYGSEDERVYLNINRGSSLYYEKNGELFVTLLKWLNLIEHEQNIDILCSPSNWVIITYAIHKYLLLIIFVLICILGCNILTISASFCYLFSIWMHSLQLYTKDHAGIANVMDDSEVNAYDDESTVHCLWFTKYMKCRLLIKMMQCLLWPGILFAVVFGYYLYVLVFHDAYFFMIWCGMVPAWLMTYSLLTRGYRRIYLFHGLALFSVYCASFVWFTVDLRLGCGLLLVFAEFCWYLAFQFDFHRLLLFPQCSHEFRYSPECEAIRVKFGETVDGAKKFTATRYANTYFRKARRGESIPILDTWFMERSWQGIIPTQPNFTF